MAAAVAGVVGVTAVGAVGVGFANNPSDGPESVFVPTLPCRAFDNRSGELNVGDRDTALEAGETWTIQLTGDPGECTGIPEEATALSLNLAKTKSTTESFASMWPADQDQPNASVLNWGTDGNVVVNNIDVQLSADGKAILYNHLGDATFLGDVLGYYVAADVGGEPGPQGPQGEPGPPGPGGSGGGFVALLPGVDGVDGTRNVVLPPDYVPTETIRLEIAVLNAGEDCDRLQHPVPVEPFAFRNGASWVFPPSDMKVETVEPWADSVAGGVVTTYYRSWPTSGPDWELEAGDTILLNLEEFDHGDCDPSDVKIIGASFHYDGGPAEVNQAPNRIL